MDSPASDGSARLDRRSVLGSALAFAVLAPLSACTGDDPQTRAPRSTVTPAPTTAAPSGDAALAAAALGDEEMLHRLCVEAVRRVRRRDRDTFRGLVARQRAVITALRQAMTDPTATGGRRLRLPRGRRQTLRTLTDALAAAEGARLDDCLAAESGPLARLLASISASHAVAVEQVRALR